MRVFLRLCHCSFLLLLLLKIHVVNKFRCERKGGMKGRWESLKVQNELQSIFIILIASHKHRWIRFIAFVNKTWFLKSAPPSLRVQTTIIIEVTKQLRETFHFCFYTASSFQIKACMFRKKKHYIFCFSHLETAPSQRQRNEWKHCNSNLRKDMTDRPPLALLKNRSKHVLVHFFFKKGTYHK